MTTADKLLATFALFAGEKVEWTVEEAAHELSIPASTVYPYFRSLSEAGLVAATSPGRYVLGPTIVMLDRRMRLTDPLMVPANEVMQQIRSTAAVPGVLLLCRLFRHQVMCVLSVDVGQSGLEVSYERGRLMPLFRGAASKVILAHLPTRTVKSFHQQQAEDFRSAGLGHDWDEVKLTLRDMRGRSGLATFGELDKGLVGVASPIMAADGAVLGSIGFVAAQNHMTAETTDSMLDVVTRAAHRITIAQRL